mmetsp:Transcript_34619/g.101744  ORF Transcript_34619/g.101744 Transcript_34619/m.101744 type:complete len:671 (-) Transcript_34619:2775-4787(-)
MQRRGAARGASAAGGDHILPLTTADVEQNAAGQGSPKHANGSARAAAAAPSASKMKLRRRKRKMQRSDRKRKRLAARSIVCACLLFVVLIVLALFGRGPLVRRRSSRDDEEDPIAAHVDTAALSKAYGYITADGYAPLRRMLFSFGNDKDDELSNPDARCDDSATRKLLNRDKLDTSLALGLHFLTQHQRPAGNFDYEFDWSSGEQSEDDSQVRQAGALWGLSLIFHDMMDHVDEEASSSPSPSRDAVLKDVTKRLKSGIEFFRKHSRVLNRPIADDDGGSALAGINRMRYVTYPDAEENDQGTQALLCLALVDFLRGMGSPEQAVRAGLTVDDVEEYRELLDEFLPFMVTQHSALSNDRFASWDELVAAGARAIDSGIWYGNRPKGSEQTADLQMEKWWDENVFTEGAFHSRFDLLGERKGKPSPYYDGESLLAVTKASKYLGPAYAHLWPLAAGTASSLHELHVVKALRKDEDSDDTKGVYQWLSMSLFELSTVTFGSGRKERFDLPEALQRLYRVEQFGSWLTDLAVWMVDVHETLRKGKNTGYAYEGIVPAFSWSVHMMKVKKFGRTDQKNIETVRKLHCTINKGMSKLLSWQVGMGAEQADDKWDGISGLGGVQNSADESGLRIDVTQHQMHATILTRRYVYPRRGSAWPWTQAAGPVKAAAKTK